MSICRKCWELGTTDCPHNKEMIHFNVPIEYLERMKYPSLDVKRRIIDLFFAGAINTLNEEVEELEERVEKLEHKCKFD